VLFHRTDLGFSLLPALVSRAVWPKIRFENARKPPRDGLRAIEKPRLDA
jgi:hypothetical protein